MEQANLNALNFISRDTISVFTGQVDMDMKGTNLDDLYGTIRDVDKLKNNNYLVVTGGHLLEIDKFGKVVMDIGAKPALGMGHRILYKAQRVYPDGSFSHD